MIQTQDMILKRAYRKLDQQGQVVPIDYESMQYLLLLFYNDDEKNFEIITGRGNVIQYLIENLDDIDIKKSFLLTETTTLEDNVKLKDFLIEVCKAKLVDTEEINRIMTTLENISFEN